MTFPLLRQDAAILQLLQRPRGCIGQACFSPHSSRSTERQRTASFCDASAMQALRKHCAYPLSEPKRSVRVAASAAAAGGDQDSGVQTSSLVNTLILGGLFAGWYAANIYFNIYNKQVLKVFPFPMTCTTIQFAVGSLITAACWAAGIVKLPKVTPAVLKRVAPLAFAHTLGNLLTNMSLGLVAVSFTHTIKASEPLFSVALSMLVLGDRPHPLVLATLVPIIGGVGIASLSEASFNWGGFLTAMGSNLTFQSRNVLSKKLMGAKGPDTIDKTNLFGMMTIMAFFMLLPIAIAVEGWQLAPAALDALGITNHQELLSRALATGLTFHLYQQVSYLILERVSPVTHSIGNCVKRVVVIVASVIFFQNPMSTQNMLGTAIALAGVFAYSQVKRLASPKGKPAAAASE